MTKPIALVVTDTSPLITLALADALHLLAVTGLQVRIPDAVYVEATRLPKAGADQIMKWLAAAPENVRLIPTSIGLDQRARLEAHRSIRNMGETAAFEVANGHLDRNPDHRVILLYEDRDVLKRTLLGEHDVVPVTTGDFLKALELTGVIKSADQILEQAREGGFRNLEKALPNSMPAEHRVALERALERAKDDSDRDLSRDR